MKIGIDITPIIYDRGVSRYTSNLVQALAQRSDVELRLYGTSMRQKQRLEDFAQEVCRFRSGRHQARIQSYPPKVQEFLWNSLGKNHIRKIFPDVEVFHSWDWLQPPDKDLPLVSTIHDLAILRYPETALPKVVKLHQHSWKVLRQQRAQVITVSQATRRDVIELLHFPPQDVHVVYESLPLESLQVSQRLTEERQEQIKQQLQLNQPFILCVGTREPRKNLRRAIEAWWPLRQDVQLIVAGAAGWDQTEELQEKLQSTQLRFLGKVTDEELAVLYGEAELLLYPSLYEGFGLPILEAFHFGTPVVTSNTSAMPEIAGNAAELVEPTSVESIRKGIVKVLTENNEAGRRRLQQMIIRLQLFNWQRVAEETCKVYRKAIQLHAQR
ncbi:glycosyltransferase family 4 protein [Patescibacteria group bacterium]|nr:glycosyltransferase family 4 protein [Patescibacteria group bacterium]